MATYAQLCADLTKSNLAAGARPHRVARDFSMFAAEVGCDRDGATLIEDHLNAILDASLVECHAFNESGGGARRHLSIVAPPGIRKSTRARLFTLYRLGRNPKASVVFTSADKSTACNNVSLCRDIITRAKPRDGGIHYGAVFPGVIPDMKRSKGLVGGVRGWRQDKFFLVTNSQSADAAMEAVSLNTKAEARRIDILGADDIVTRRVAMSPKLRRENAEAFFRTFIGGRLARNGWCFALQNCWHKDDLAHQCLSDARFCSVWIGVNEDCNRLEVRITNPPPGFSLVARPEAFQLTPATAPEGVDYAFTAPLPNDPGYTTEALRALAANPNVDFQRSHRLIAMTDDDRMLPHWSERRRHVGTVAEMLGLQELAGLPVFGPLDRHRYSLAVGLDLAGATRRGDSITVMGRDGRNVFPIEHHIGNYSIEAIFEILDGIWRRGIHFGVCLVENNGVQDKIKNGLRMLAREQEAPWVGRILPFQTGKNKADPNIGLPSLDVEIQTGYIVWPEGEAKRDGAMAAYAAGWRALESHLAECPKILGSGETPDDMMSLWFARCGLGMVSAARPGELTAAAAHPGGGGASRGLVPLSARRQRPI